ncbi:hypothetical protein SPURM210S_03718 [Streptomyces purpurascens]|nr:hypothetical protein GCM10010303_79810 [Streptomyces purpurascens]
MKPRSALGALALVTMPLFLATPAQAAEPEAPVSLSGAPATRNGGPVGPGLSELVAIAEGILRKYGI